MDETDKRNQLIMSHFGYYLKITSGTQEAARLANEAAEKLLQIMEEVKEVICQQT